MPDRKKQVSLAPRTTHSYTRSSEIPEQVHRKRIHGQTETKRRSCIYGEKDQRLRSNWCFLWARVWDILLTWTPCSPSTGHSHQWWWVWYSSGALQQTAQPLARVIQNLLSIYSRKTQKNEKNEDWEKGHLWLSLETELGVQPLFTKSDSGYHPRMIPVMSAKQIMILLPSCSHSPPPPFFLLNSMPDAHRDHKKHWARWNWHHIK